MSKLATVLELVEFMREQKKYWMAPIIIMLIVVGVLLIVAKGSVLAPFIYALF